MKFQKITYFKKQDNLYCVCCIDTFKIKTIDYEKFSKIKNKYIMLSSSKDVNKKTLKDYTQNQFLKRFNEKKFLTVFLGVTLFLSPADLTLIVASQL